MFQNLGTTEILLILAVVVLLFGAKKLPELARGSGRALRIFKAETKGLHDDDDEKSDREAIESAKDVPNPVADSQKDADSQKVADSHKESVADPDKREA